MIPMICDVSYILYIIYITQLYIIYIYIAHSILKDLAVVVTETKIKYHMILLISGI